MIWLLSGYMWLFVHRPFEVWPSLGALHVERIYMAFTVLYWLVIAEKCWTPSRLNAAFGLLWLAVLASWLQSRYAAAGAGTVEDYFKVAVFYALVVTTVRGERDLKILLIAYLTVMGLYMTHALREYLFCGRSVYRMGVKRMIGVDTNNGDPNTFSATILYSLPMVIPAWTMAAKTWQRGLLAGFTGLSVGCILLTGSRSSFVGLCFLVVCLSMASRHRWKLAALLVLASPLVWMSLREDLQKRFITLIDPSAGPRSAQSSAEGRLQGWNDGLMLWRKNPTFGVGPGAFGLATGSGFQSHELYAQVLGELGTLGLAAFLFVLWGFFSNWWSLRRLVEDGDVEPENPLARLVGAIALTVVLMLLMGLGGHNLFRYTWLWFGAFEAVAMRCLRDPADEAAEGEDGEPADFGDEDPYDELECPGCPL